MNAHLPPPARDLRAARSRIDGAVRLAARLTERREGAIAGEAALVRSVGLAKGRLHARKGVEAYLDALQARQNERNLGTFEAMLTAFVTEVLPGQPRIRLELGTERNLPALDVLAERPSGHREDVFDDQGGAVTNAISAALRLIAVVKSRSALFVALDEADCWIKPDRAPAFYRVLEDAARRLGVQCLAISHHDVTTFDANIQVSRLEGSPEDESGVRILPPEPSADWPDPAARGIRHLRLANVQGYVDQTLRLGPGLNAIVGPNNIGKSSMARAMRALLLGETRDSLVRHGAKQCTIEMGIENGRLLRLVRQPNRTPVNTWSLHEADGSVVTEGGMRYETGAKSVPDWVGRLTGIAPIQDLDVHIAHQKRPVFLLADPPSRRASVLSIGQESDYARSMIRIQKERCASDTAEVREGEREIARLRRLAEGLEGIEGQAEQVAALSAELDRLVAESAAISAREAALARLTASRTALDRAERRRDVLQGLPEREEVEGLGTAIRDCIARERAADALSAVVDRWHAAYDRALVFATLPEAAPELRDTVALARAANALRASRRALARANARAAILEGLPPSPPVIADGTRRAAALTALERSAAGLRAAEERGREIAAREREAREGLERLLEGTGGSCPACGQPVASVDALLGVHAHAPQGAAS